MPDATPQRRYDIDALRVIAFGLLILYHCGMFYVADWGWHIKSEYTSVWLQEPMRFLNQWRMSLLFVISGLAVAFVRTKYSGGELALRRVWRLLLPLIFGMAVIIAPQCYFEALNKGIIEPGYWNFWMQYLTFQDFPGNAWGGENEIVWTWNHLWYLPYILFYTLLVIPVGALARRAGLHTAFRKLRGPWLIAIPVIPLMLYGNFVFPHYPGIDHSLIGDNYAHVLYGTLFFYGYLIGRDTEWWAALADKRRLFLTVGILAYISLRTQDLWVSEDSHFLIEQLSFLSVYVNRWTWILVLFAYGFQYLNQPKRWIAYSTAAIFPWYILHQTLTVILGGTLSPYQLGPIIEPLLVIGGTAIGCLVLYEFVIRRIPLLRPLFGMPIHTSPRRDVNRPSALSPSV
ncbi:MAG: acyltransferase family protein [Pseudomonadota bacterium]